MSRKTYSDTFTSRANEFLVTLELYTESGEARSDCFIECRDFSASLECADAMGVLTDSRGREMHIPASVCEEVRDWADGLGY